MTGWAHWLALGVGAWLVLLALGVGYLYAPDRYVRRTLAVTMLAVVCSVMGIVLGHALDVQRGYLP
jgi:hypothetical protein